MSLDFLTSGLKKWKRRTSNMLRCSWCMKKIKEDNPCFGLNVKFKEGIDINEQEGKIISLHLTSRNTSVPFIVVASGSEAKQQGTDGIFAICSEKCGTKMKSTLDKEIDLFSGYSTILSELM